MTFLDLETTGLSITNDRIVQVAFVKNGKVKKMLINPTIPIPKEATEIHGITDEMVKDCKTFAQVSKSMNEYLKGEDLAGYNSNIYDIPLLMEEFGRAGIDFDLKGRRIIDAYKLECQLNPRDLASVYKRMTGKTLDDAHDAEVDALATAEIFEKQVEILGDDAYAQDENAVDLAGQLIRNEKGEICWTFGKNKGQPIKKDRNYCNWVLRSDFSRQLKEIIKAEL